MIASRLRTIPQHKARNDFTLDPLFNEFHMGAAGLCQSLVAFFRSVEVKDAVFTEDIGI
jgi:hypothetical protein